MKPLFTILAFALLFSFSGTSQIQNFYNYVNQNLEGYDSAGFFFIKKPNSIPPGAFFDIYVAASGDMDNAIALKKTWVDNQLGMTHYRYQQTYKGVTVEVGEATEHYNANELDYVNGKLVYNLNRTVTPDITAAQAVTNAKAYLTPSIDGGGDTSKPEAQNIQIVGTPELLLAIDNYDNLSVYIDGARYTLAWKILAMDTIVGYNSALFVNANTGVVFREDDLNHYGHSNIRYHGNQFIDTDWVGFSKYTYYTRATDNGRNIETRYNKSGTDVYGFDKDDDWGWNENEATTPHWFAMKSWDYFKTKFNRLGLDGSGGEVRVYTEQLSATRYFYYGGRDFIYLSKVFANDGHAIDLVGHEYSHGINEHTAGMPRLWEPGALNESFADIFGFMIEAFAEGGVSDWTIGEDPNLPILRSLESPKSLGFHYNGSCNDVPGQPDTYQGQFWSASGCGNGGIHVNSGVQNYWFYLLANSGSGTNDNQDTYAINGIGIDYAAEIAYFNITNNLQSGAQFADARAGSIKYVQNKWGICSNFDIQNTNAWHAVGVGPKSTCNVTSVPKIQKQLEIKVFPNPSSGFFTINTIGGEIGTIKVFALDGKLVSMQNPVNQHTHNIDLSFLRNGVYLIEDISNGFTTREQIIINH